jgi:uncharacterized protein YkwD
VIPVFIKKLLAASAAAGAVPAAHADATERTEQDALEREVTEEVQAVRRQYGLPSLRYVSSLAAGADARSRDMARRGYFAHTDSSGAPFWIVVRRFYPVEGWRSWKVGENLLWTVPRLDARTIVRRWLASPTHRAVLLKAIWRDVGVGAVRVQTAPGVYARQNVTIVTLEFGVRRR